MSEDRIKLKNVVGHFRTITRHRHEVIRNCFKAGIGFQGLFHDLSKYSPEEFLNGCRYYQGTRSPHEGERDDNGYSKAWMHHKGRNKHHYEYWIDYCIDPVDGHVTTGGNKMPKKYVAEMVCDRIAACRVYQGDKYTSASPYDYYQRSKGSILIHPDTSDLLDRWLLLLKDKDETDALAQIRAELRDKNFPY